MGKPEYPRFGVARLGHRRYRARLDMSEAQGGKARYCNCVFVESGRHTDRVGELEAEGLDIEPGVFAYEPGPEKTTQCLPVAGEPQKAQGQVVAELGIEPGQQDFVYASVETHYTTSRLDAGLMQSIMAEAQSQANSTEGDCPLWVKRYT
jgi:hypothetical protein